MGKTFGDLRGKRHRVENFDGTDCDQDILTDAITNYYACYDGEPIVEVSEEVYNALNRYFESFGRGKL